MHSKKLTTNTILLLIFFVDIYIRDFNKFMFYVKIRFFFIQSTFIHSSFTIWKGKEEKGGKEGEE
jgi:hypothetical protein